MEKESTSTWAFLNKSGEIVNVEADPGSSSESSIEFIRDEAVHYERNNNHRSSLQPEVQEESEDVAETSSEVLTLDGGTAADNVSAVKDEEGGEINRSELTLENITSTDSNVSVSPNSTSPVSPSSSDDSSGSVTLLEGRFSDGDLDTFPEDFWFDSDFELLDQHSSSDLAHLQLAAGASNALPATHRPKFNFKLKKQGMGISEIETETESVNVSDADDESSTNVELCSSIEESEVASIEPIDEIPPVTNLGSLAPVPPHLPVPTLTFKPPRMSVTFLMLASLVIGLLLGITTKYSLDPYSSEQLSEDIAEMQRINEMHLLKEENDHMRKYVDSLKWRMNSLQNSNKQQLSDELRQVNQLLKGRIDELDQQILAVRHEIFEAKSGVKPPIISDTGNQHIPAADLQDVNEPEATLNNDPELQTEINNHVGAVSHDDIIQIHSSPEEVALEESQGIQIYSNHEELALGEIHSNHEELTLEESQDIQIHSNPEELALEKSQGSTEQMSTSGVSLVDIPNNDAPSISSDEIIKSENKVDDTIVVLQMKLEEEKKRADNLAKLYAELKQLVDSRKLATDSSVETVEGAKAKRAKESVKYCSPLDKDCSMDWLNQDVMLHLITSVMAEIPPQAQQWKEYMAHKFQSILDPQIEQEPVKELEDEPEMDSNFQFKKLNIYMNRMLDQMNRAKDDLQNKFEKTLDKIKKGTNQFWEKAAARNEKEMKKSIQRKKDLMDIEDSEGSQDSSLQLIEENNLLEDVDAKKEYKSQKTEKFGQLQKGLEIAEIDQNKHDDDDKIRSNENNKHHHRSDERKKTHPHKSNYKDKKQSDNKNKKHKSKFDEKNGPQKSSDHEEKKYRSHKSQSDEKKHKHKSDDDDKKHRLHKSDDDDDKKHRLHKSDDDDDKKHKLHKFDDDDDIKHRPHKSDNKKHKAQKLDNEDKKRRNKYDDEDDQPSKFDDDDESFINKKHRSHRSNDKKNNLKKNKHQHNDKKTDDTTKSKKKLQRNNEKIDDTTKSKKKLQRNNEKIDDTTKSKKKLQRNNKKIDDTTKSKKKLQRNNKKIDDTTKSKKKLQRNNKKIDDTTKSTLQKNLKKKRDKKYKDNFEMKTQSKESCDQLAVKLEDSISTISKEKFRRMNLKTILRMSKKLSNFNKQCKHFSSNTVKEWSACQQMWWTLCGQRGFLPGQLQNSKCQHYLLGWQLLAAASPDGGGKSGCDDCGCQNKAGKQKEDRQNATDSDSAFENMKEEEKKVMSGEWYFKHKSVPAEKSGEWYFKHKTVPAEKNNDQDCDENKFQSASADLWDEMEDDKLQHMDKMLNAEFHRLNHYNHVHRRRCRDYNNHINCYNWFHPTYVGKWASVYYQNLMNIMQKWQK